MKNITLDWKIIEELWKKKHLRIEQKGKEKRKDRKLKDRRKMSMKKQKVPLQRAVKKKRLQLKMSEIRSKRQPPRVTRN